MLWRYVGYCCPGLILLSLIFWALAVYSFRVNAKRAPNDPKKKDFQPAAIFLVPLTWPLLFLVWLSLLLIKALVYGVFLVLFTIALFAYQDSGMPDWLTEKLTWIGNKLLEANTFLMKVAFGDWKTQPI